jgi:type III pantothenate kinase
MNLVAIDIGNTNIRLGLFLDGNEDQIEIIPGSDDNKLQTSLKSLWEKIPLSKRSKEHKRDGVFVLSSVKTQWTEKIEKFTKQLFDEKPCIIGKDIPLPMELSIEHPEKVGIDRIVTAAAAYSVIEEAVVVADFGTAVTIDLVDDRGVFVGGVIFPGFELCAIALHENTAQLPKVTVTRPDWPFGKNTAQAINCGLYYSAVSTLQELTRRYAETIGKWPHVVMTGSAAAVIKDDCDFVDSYVPNLVIKGIALAYRKYIEGKDN